MLNFIIFIIELIYLVIMCFWNGFLIKWAIDAFNCKTYVIFGAYCTLIFMSFVSLVNHIYLPVGKE